jgi:hypothetical protein
LLLLGVALGASGAALGGSDAAADERGAAAVDARDGAPASSGSAAPSGAAVDALVLHVGGRLQFDHYSYFAPGAEAAGLEPNFLLRRFNFELSGQLARRWRFFLQADFAPAGLDAAQGPASKPTAAIVIFNHRLADALNVQVGQLLTPVTLDHRLLSRERVLLENGLVQQLGAPSPVEIGASAWGTTPAGHLAYELGVFNGDGANRWSPDRRVDLIGRLEVKPLAAAAHVLRGAQLGGSVRIGARDPDRITYDAPGLATQGGFRFWRSTYETPDGTVHIRPAGRQLVVAAQARVPLDRVDVMAELVHVRNGTREAPDVGAAARTGTLSGLAAYGQLGVWVVGSRAVLDPAAPASRALELVARAELLRARYAGGRRSAMPDAPGADGAIRVNAWVLGAKYWWNSYVRGSVNYCIYQFPESGPVIADPESAAPGQTSRQRAVSPGNTLGLDAGEAARTSHALHELLVRVELGF